MCINPKLRFLFLPFALLIVGVFAFSCGSGYPDFDEISRGTQFSGRQGHPEIRLSTIGLFDEEQQPGINIAIDVVYGSLIYKNKEDQYIANIALELKVRNKQSGNLVYSKTYDLEVNNPTGDITRSTGNFNFEQRVIVSSGVYEVIAIVTDLSSQKESAQVSEVRIPDKSAVEPNLTNVILQAKKSDDDSFRTISSYAVSNKEDSLKFVFQVTNNTPGRRVTVESELIAFETDTLPARPMSFNNYTRSSIRFKGIDYTQEERIQSNRRVITQGGSVLVEFVIPQLPRGNYRFYASVTDSSGQQKTLKAREFGIRSANYPEVKTVYELREPLYYLMDRKQYKEIMAIEDPDSIKKAIDFFWLTNVGRTNKAKNVISMYYERVEQANKLFGNWKEGWKTDMGMVYILFGPPWYVDRNLNVMLWSYTYNRSDPELNFAFDRILPGQPYFPYENYIFRRNRGYYQIEYNQIDVWLSGLVLQGR